MADEKDKKEEKKDDKKVVAKDNLVVTHHSAKIGGKTIKYTVTTGTIVLKEETESREKETEAEKPKAQFFFVAYTKDGEKNTAKRPLTFSFNGGPGSASVWLHLGVLGPRRVVMTNDGDLPPPPYTLTNNEFSLLDESDLVFIDPISTGYSRPAEGQAAKQFHGFRKDIQSVGDFIHLYTTRYQRWLSPKFLIGESYGTTRASGLSSYLMERHGLYLNGVMLISSVLDFSTLEFEHGNDLPYIVFLPTFAATAFYHKKARTDKPLRKFLDEVEAFAAGEYTLALMKGSALSSAERKSIAKKLSDYTGLSEDYLKRINFRINIFRFVKELLRDEDRTVGRLDSRFKGIDRDTAGETFEEDPSYTNIMGPYTATFYDYVRGDLKFESDLPYEILNFKVWPWSYSDHENRYVYVAEMLRQAMTRNPYMKVFVANGYYDLATPYFATEYTFNHMSMEPEIAKNVSMEYYEAGHMMYIHIPSLKRMKTDLAKFIKSALKK